MPADNTTLLRRFVVLGVLVVILLALLTVYSLQKGEFAAAHPAASYSPPLVNAELLKNWLPPVSYKETIARINSYLRSNNLLTSTMAVKGNLSINQTDGTYDFALELEPQNQTHNVSVIINNYDGILSTAVTIDGTQQGTQAPSQLYNPSSSTSTRFSGIDSLLDKDVSSMQGSELQTALQKFAPTAQDISIDPNTLKLPPLNSTSLTNTYTFSVAIDGKQYSAKFNCIGLTQSQLFLSDQKGKQVFDSGVLSQN